MTVTVITRPPNRSNLRSEIPKPTVLAELAEWLTIERASERPAKVLLITGAIPHLVMHADIRRKPGAMQIETACKNWPETWQRVERFCAVLDDPKSKAYAAGARHKAVVIVNDADCFVAGSVGEGLFTRTCDKHLMSRVEKIGRLVEPSGGELIVMAVLEPDSTYLCFKTVGLSMVLINSVSTFEFIFHIKESKVESCGAENEITFTCLTQLLQLFAIVNTPPGNRFVLCWWKAKMGSLLDFASGEQYVYWSIMVSPSKSTFNS